MFCSLDSVPVPHFFLNIATHSTKHNAVTIFTFQHPVSRIQHQVSGIQNPAYILITCGRKKEKKNPAA